MSDFEDKVLGMLGGIVQRLDAIDGRLDRMDERFRAINARLDEQDAQLDRLHSKMDRVQTVSLAASQAAEQALSTLSNLSRRVGRLENPDPDAA